MTAYILQAILFQLLFLLVYEFSLKKETFFTYNRWYLLITTVLSFLLPLIKIESLGLLVPAESLTQMTTIFLPEVFIGGSTPAGSIEHLPEVLIESSVAAINPWLVVYFFGVLTALIIVLKKYKHLRRMFRFKKIAAEGYVNIIEVPNSTIACTFYRTIFLGDGLTEAEKQQILSHELVHVKQKHSLDLVFFEVLKVIFWFNPLIYIYQNRIATVHEFIADAAVVQVATKRSYYEQLLNSAFNTNNISFINQFFNHSLIRKRIIMLQKSRSKSISKFKYLLMVPLMLVMLTYVACSDEATSETETTLEAKNQDEAMKAAFWNEILLMEDNGASRKEISDAFFSPGKERLSREEYYRFQTFMKYMQKKVVENKKAEGTYNEELEKKFLQSIENRTYEDYLNDKNNSGITMKTENITADSPDVPFAIVEQVPVFPGCENLFTNEERKKCMSDKVNEFVTKNFDIGLGKKLGLTGMNRVIVVFKISPEGNITDVRARAPHPDLEVEAKRVIEGLPQMTPGVQKGQNVGVSYSLPIVFQVGE